MADQLTVQSTVEGSTAQLPKTGIGDWSTMGRVALVLELWGIALLLSTRRRRSRPRHARGRHA